MTRDDLEHAMAAIRKARKALENLEDRAETVTNKEVRAACALIQEEVLGYSNLLEEAAEKLLAMRPATEAEIGRALPLDPVEFGSYNDTKRQAYRTAERRLLPFADDQCPTRRTSR